MNRYQKLHQRSQNVLLRISRTGNWQKWIAVREAWITWTLYQEV